MALRKFFSLSPYAIPESGIRRFSADEALRDLRRNKLVPAGLLMSSIEVRFLPLY
jgi:hypothetical protein